jgi:hypothetical protein
LRRLSQEEDRAQEEALEGVPVPGLDVVVVLPISWLTWSSLGITVIGSAVMIVPPLVPAAVAAYRVT